MANLSDANGKIIISTNNILDVLKITDIIRKYDDCEYCTRLDESTLDYLKEKIKLLTAEQRLEVKLQSFYIDFYGTGRWSYASNIEWIKNDIQKSDISNASIEFDYVDYEPGCVFFIDVNRTLKIVNKTIVEESEVTNIDITAQNLILHDIYETAFDNTKKSIVEQIILIRQQEIHEEIMSEDMILHKLSKNTIDELQELFDEEFGTDNVISDDELYENENYISKIKNLTI